jgi:pilus assembly protein CpaE
MQNHFEDQEAAVGASDLSIALIGPNENRRRIVANALAGAGSSAVREFPSYPNKTTDVPRMMEQNFDVYIIDLDGDQRLALELVEEIAANPAITVMVYSMNNDPNLLMSCMRSGAREFLSQPVALGPLNEALSRASTRRPTTRMPSSKGGGKVLVFLGGKGGSGVTTVACNFAVSLV